jgi:glyoxylate reductase
MPAVLVTRKLPSSVLSKLERVAALDVYAGEDPMPADELRARAAAVDALVSSLTDSVDQPLLDAATRLKIVANLAVGFNNVDVDYARLRGVIVTNTPDVLTESVADFTWGLVIAISRRIVEGDRLVRRGDWRGWTFDFLLGSEIGGKRLGVIGFGRIGQAVARRAAAFGMQVAYTSRGERAGTDAEPMPLDRLLNTSDVVSVHVPLTKETHHLIGRRELARMKRSAYLINTSRGQVVDEAALAWALSERLIAGAALDVYAREPEVSADLVRLENVVLVPHLGSATTETRTAMADLAAANVVAVLSGEPPLTPVP